MLKSGLFLFLERLSAKVDNPIGNPLYSQLTKVLWQSKLPFFGIKKPNKFFIVKWENFDLNVSRYECTNDTTFNFVCKFSWFKEKFDIVKDNTPNRSIRWFRSGRDIILPTSMLSDASENLWNILFEVFFQVFCI